jgi:homoserine kinase type II
MAVKTKFSQKDFVQILGNYELGDFVQADPVAQGTVQTNYFVHTTEGKFVFRYYECRSKESVLFECQVLTYLKKYQFPCPKPFQDQNGVWVNEFRRKPYVISEFMDGLPVENQNLTQKRQLIQVAAKLQTITKNYQPKYWEHRWNYNGELCRQLASEAAEKINTQDAFKKLAWLENQLSLLSLPDTIPMGVCHCDFHYSNILFKHDKLVGLIDFDDANYTYLMFDLVGLIDWEWPHTSNELDFEVARNIAQEYLRHRQLSEIEKQHTFDVHKLGILFDCIWFFARGQSTDFYEKRKIDLLNYVGRDEYASRLFH